MFGNEGAFGIAQLNGGSQSAQDLRWNTLGRRSN